MADVDSVETVRRAGVPVAAVCLVALLVLGVGGMVALEAGPLGGANDAPATQTPTPTAGADGLSDDGDGSSDEGGDDSSDDGSDGASASASPERPFTLRIRNVEKCGRACRDVTVALVNDGGTPRTGIEAATTMYAGDDVVWEDEASIGRLGPGESTARTERVKVGFVGAAKIKRNGGTVTVETVVRWDGGSTTFTERKRVA